MNSSHALTKQLRRERLKSTATHRSRWEQQPGAGDATRCQPGKTGNAASEAAC